MTIDEWFESEGDESEFIANVSFYPYTILGPRDAATPVVFTTKPPCVLSNIRAYPELESMPLVGRRGLPSQFDLNWLRCFIGQRRVLFLGDMDPPDLMVYAWLRDNLKDINVSHFGVSDNFIKALKVQLPNSFIMSFAPSEIASLPLLAEVFPDFRDVVGHECTQLLEAGSKIELEAIVSALAGSAPILSMDMLGLQ